MIRALVIVFAVACVAAAESIPESIQQRIKTQYPDAQIVGMTVLNPRAEAVRYRIDLKRGEQSFSVFCGSGPWTEFFQGTNVPPELAEPVHLKWPTIAIVCAMIASDASLRSGGSVIATLDGKRIEVHLANAGGGWHIESYRREIALADIPEVVVTGIRQKHLHATIESAMEERVPEKPVMEYDVIIVSATGKRRLVQLDREGKIFGEDTAPPKEPAIAPATQRDV